MGKVVRQMRQAPSNKIDKDAVKVWKIHAALGEILWWVIMISLTIVTVMFDLPEWMLWIGWPLLLLYSYINIFLLPVWRWKRWRYQVYEQEIDLQRGIFIMKRTLIPMIRVQHVDTKQGPILKKFGLSTVTISTAATIHEIPALPEEEGSELRDRISTLARVDESDV